jgi:hypothetical protein
MSADKAIIIFAHLADSRHQRSWGEGQGSTDAIVQDATR